MIGVVGKKPGKRLPDDVGEQGVFSSKCSGPGGSGMAEAVLGGTGGHSPSSGLAGKVECRGPDEVNLSFLHRLVLCSWTNLLQRVKRDQWLCLYI